MAGSCFGNSGPGRSVSACPRDKPLLKEALKNTISHRKGAKSAKVFTGKSSRFSLRPSRLRGK
jgi:hypothetical protein